MYNKFISAVTAVAFMIFSSAFVGLTRSYAATINISPTQDIQTAVNANPTGTTFVIAAGLYRMQSVTPKTGDVFLGQPGAILNGSRQLTSFARSGSYYIAGGQTQHGTAVGVCLSGYTACQYPEDLFFNNVPLQRVATLAEVTAGKWYFDYPTAEVYFVDDPTGKTVEIGVTTHAFSGSATSVTINGFTIEKYANPAQDGPISGRNWTIESNEIRLNHGGGIRLDSYQVIKSNYIHHNGQEGLTGTGANVLVQGNEIAYNNTLNFDFGWEAGGTKFSNMTNLVVQGNYSHDNKGPGFSLDYQCYNWTIQANRTSNNYVAGILDETSYDGAAKYNVIVNDGWYPGKTNPSMWWGCGIQNLDSGNESVYGNTLLNNSNGICAVSFPRGSGNRGEFLVKNLYAHDNFIVQNVSSGAGAVASTANSGYYLSVYTSWNNRWASNTYQLSNLAGNFYIWTGGSSVDDLQWKIDGQDTAGTWISSTTTFLSTKFSPNQRVQTLLSAQVWSLPDTTSTLITTETTGAQGTVTQVAGPIHSGGVWWWNVKYDNGQEGWTQETSLGNSSPNATAAATPTLSPSAGTYTAPSGITISDSSPGVTIYYTTDGSTPTTASPVYTTQVQLSTATTLKAMASGNGYSASAVASASYVFQAAKPTFSPAAGTYNSTQSVTIADSSPGVTIYYTTNGTTPTASSPVYTAAIPVSATTTIQAIAKRSGFLDSPLASATYKTLAPTTTTLGSSANPSTYGQSVMFTATVAPTSGTDTPTGSVTFKDGSTLLGTVTLSGGTVLLSTSILSVGSHSITANYSGDSNYSSSVSGTLSQGVSGASTTTTVSSSANPSTLGQSVTLTANVSPAAATGTVQFFDGATSLGTATLSGGKAALSTSTLSVGPNSITAQYSGDTNYTGSTSSVLTQTVNSLISTTTSLTSSPNPSVRGQQVTFTATVKPSSGTGTPTGTVTLLDGSSTLGSSALNASWVATLSTSNLSVGTHSITARYGGDTNYNGSTSAVLSQTVKRKK